MHNYVLNCSDLFLDSRWGDDQADRKGDHDSHPQVAAVFDLRGQPAGRAHSGEKRNKISLERSENNLGVVPS